MSPRGDRQHPGPLTPIGDMLRAREGASAPSQDVVAPAPLPRIDVDAIEQALRGKHLAYGRLINENGDRCARGELAHVAGVSDATLRAADSSVASGDYITAQITARFGLPLHYQWEIVFTNDRADGDRAESVLALVQSWRLP